ncbi:MAG: response regulator [Proteobacteria bacterium]|nr:response regulator [Pseudomonadota bacterium]
MQVPAAKTRHPRLQQRLVQAIGADGRVELELLLDALEGDYAAADASELLGEHLIRRTEAGAADISSMEARRQARLNQARVDLVLEHASEAVVSVTATGEITSFNRAAERLWGWTAEEVLGRHMGMLFDGGWTEFHDRSFGRWLVKVSADAPFELATVGKDGRKITVEGTRTHVEVEGELIAMSFWRDVTERRAAETALRQAAETADRANTAKTEFLAAMSHEIRTPLNGVLGMAAALETTPLSDLQRRMLGVINESGQSLMTLLSDILDLSKVEAGHMEFEQTPFDLSASLQAVENLYEETARAKNLELRVSAEPEARGVYLGDPTRLRQVLQNLISNALKFTANGGVEVRASATTAPGGRVVRFEVTDTGVGVSEEARDRLFSKFMQADRSTSRKFGGTGLGLAICRELVTAMNGEIGVNSEEGRGSTFWFTLPLELAAGAEPEPEVVEEERPLRILAAEDNATNQFVLKAILGQAGLEAQFVENGRLAVEAVRAADYDLILMDLHMPEMDGLTATQTIRALGGSKGAIPIVAVTAEAMPEQVRKCLAAGMDAHVAKPIRPDVLYGVIEEVLTRAPDERRTA